MRRLANMKVNFIEIILDIFVLINIEKKNKEARADQIEQIIEDFVRFTPDTSSVEQVCTCAICSLLISSAYNLPHTEIIIIMEVSLKTSAKRFNPDTGKYLREDRNTSFTTVVPPPLEKYT